MKESASSSKSAKQPVQKLALLMGIVFLIVGVLGFVPGVTTGVGDMTFASHHSEAYLLGIFQVSVLHNLVHLLFGVAGVLGAKSVYLSRAFLVGGGAAYLVLALFGLIVPDNSPVNFVPFNGQDNWLHAVLGVLLVMLSVLARGRIEFSDKTQQAPVEE